MVITGHCEARMRQRGARLADLQALVNLGDRDVPVGGGLISRGLSPIVAHQLRQAGVIEAQMADRLSRLAALVGHEDQPVVVTVMHQLGRRGRRLRRRG